MINNKTIKTELNNWLNRTIREQKFIPAYYITIKYIESKSNTIEQTEKLFSHFKNLLLCKIYRVTSKSRLPKERIRLIGFHEKGEALTHFHTHILIENIPNHPTLKSIELLLKLVQSKHKSIERGINAIHIDKFHRNQQAYSIKQTTNNYLPLDIYSSDLV